jgi:hypothetical protein
MAEAEPPLVSARAFAGWAGLAAFTAAAFLPQLLGDGDSWWHLKAGEWILDHRAVPVRDIFTFTFAGQPWNAHEWLAEVAMALSYQLGRWSGVHLLFALAAGFAAHALAGFVRARVEWKYALLATVLGVACFGTSLLARPHLLALPLLVTWTIGLLKARERNRAPAPWLLLVMLVWANLHGSFAFGLALAVALALEAVLARRDALLPWSLFLLGAAAAALLTPQGMDGLLFPFRLLLMPALSQVGEWGATDLTRPSVAVIAIAALVVLLASRQVRVPLLWLLMLAGLVYLALAHARHHLLLGAVAPLLLAAPMGARWPAQGEGASFAARLPLIACVLLVLLRLGIPVTRDDTRTTPMTALDSVPTDMRAMPVLNAYDFGGYLIFNNVRVYVDGRTDLFGAEFLAEYDRAMKPDAATLRAILARNQIGWTILPPGAAADAIDKLPGWHRTYADAFAVVHRMD